MLCRDACLGPQGSEPCPAGYTIYAGSSPWGCCKGVCPAGREWEDAEDLCFFRGSQPQPGDFSCASLVARDLLAERYRVPEQSSPPKRSTAGQTVEMRAAQAVEDFKRGQAAEQPKPTGRRGANPNPSPKAQVEGYGAGIVILCGLSLAGIVVHAITRRDPNTQALVNPQYVTQRLFTITQQQESWLGAVHLNQQPAPAPNAKAAQQSTAAALFFFMLASAIPIHCLGVTSHSGLGLLLRGALGGSAGSLLEVGVLPLLIPKVLLWTLYGTDAHNVVCDLQQRDPLLFRRGTNLVGICGCALVLVVLRLLGVYASGACSAAWYWIQIMVGAMMVCQINGTLHEASLVQYTKLQRRTTDAQSSVTSDTASRWIQAEQALIGALRGVQSASRQLYRAADAVHCMLYWMGVTPRLNPVSPWLVHQERLRMLFKVVDWTLHQSDGQQLMTDWLSLLAQAGRPPVDEDKSIKSAEDAKALEQQDHEKERIADLAADIWQSVNFGDVCQNILSMEFQGCGDVLQLLERVVEHTYHDMRIDNAGVEKLVYNIEHNSSLTLSRGFSLASVLPKLLPPGELRLRDRDNYFRLQEALPINCDVFDMFPTLYESMIVYGQACIGTWRSWVHHWSTTIPVDTIPLLICVQLICSQLVPAIISLNEPDMGADDSASRPQSQMILQLLLLYLMLHSLASGFVLLMRMVLLARGTLPEAVEQELHEDGLLDPLSAWWQHIFESFDLKDFRRDIQETVVPVYQATRRMFKLLRSELQSKAPRVSRGFSAIWFAGVTLSQPEATHLTKTTVSLSAGSLCGWLLWKFGNPAMTAAYSGIGALGAHCLVVCLMMGLQSSEWLGVVRDAYTVYCALHLANLLGLIRFLSSPKVERPDDDSVYTSPQSKLIRRSSSMVAHNSFSPRGALSPRASLSGSPIQIDGDNDLHSEMTSPKPNLYNSQVKLSNSKAFAFH